MKPETLERAGWFGAGPDQLPGTRSDDRIG
jgi:hypothetical protein